MPQAKAAPDGGVLDVEGVVWFADAIGNRVVRVAEGGKILDEISTGDQGVYACTLGRKGSTHPVPVCGTRLC
jgi:sugar lactone lactonase YvrE